MLRVYACLTQEHDLRLVALAAAICFLAAFTTFATFQRAQSGGRRWGWLALAAFVAGTGIWSTHFVAMLAFQPNLPVAYDFQRTLASVVAAIVIAGCGFLVAMRKGRLAIAGGALLVSAGIGTMHYLGMSAMHVAGRVIWDASFVATSLILGFAFSFAALKVHRSTAQNLPWRETILLTLAICSLHFVAMAAAAIYPDSRMVPVGAIDTPTLALIVTATAILILTISFAVALFDRKLARHQIAEARRAQTLADAIIEGAAERDKLSLELKQQAEISRAALDNMAQGLSMYDEHDRLVTSNQRYTELYDVPAELTEPGTPFADLIGYLTECGVVAANRQNFLGETERSAVPPGNFEVSLQNGRIIDINRRRLDSGGWIATHEDITERRQANERVAYLATHDPLTALPNRVAFAEELRAAVARGDKFALHTIDLDRFKEVNDTLGHPAGDQILKQVAQRLRGIAGERDRITRLGGDEFALIQHGFGEAGNAAAFGLRTIAALSEPFQFDGHTVVIGATVGIALAPDDGGEADDLLKKSDLALYRAKADSRGTFCFFERGMDSRLRDRRELETDLRLAIRKGQFELHYQPILNLASQAITAFEALVRWRHPTRGLLQPAEFIGTAEETGLIIPIGEWVLRQACRDAAGWPADVRVAVNLSPAQFKRGDLVAVATSALAAAGINPDRLELEITESVLLNDESWVRGLLERLRELGVRVAMDDFGTGYSSLSYLRTFPFSKIKIDRSFVSELASKSDCLAIVQATIQLSDKLGMSTTAEGVETSDQMGILHAEGCTEIQGFHISRPVPVAETRDLLMRYGAIGATMSQKVAGEAA